MWQAAQVMSSTSSPMARIEMARETDGQLVRIGRAGRRDRRGSASCACAPARRSVRATAAARDSRTSCSALHRRRRPAASKCPARCSSSAARSARVLPCAPALVEPDVSHRRVPAPGMLCTGHNTNHAYSPGPATARAPARPPSHFRNRRIALLPRRSDAYYKQRSRAGWRL